MKKILPFNKYFLPASIVSIAIVIICIVGFFTRGITLGVDFQAGIIQEVQLAPARAEQVTIAEVRTAMDMIDQPSVIQTTGLPSEHRFIIRVEDRDDAGVRPDEIERVLTAHFGEGEVNILRSEYVGARFARDLTDQAFILVFLTLLLILVYLAMRFKPRYAISAVIAIVNDAIVLLAFIIWTRMEFTTTTIAAILTVIGYSINSTVVLFDRIRENLKLFPDEKIINVFNRSISNVLGRTIITTTTTMAAVLSLYIFTTGTMQDFALALLVGMTSGVFTTLFIASFIAYLLNQKKGNEVIVPSKAEAKVRRDAAVV